MVITLHTLLCWLAVVFFIIAACPTGSRFRFECFAFAALTLAYCLV